MTETSLRLISIAQAPQRDAAALEFARAEFFSESMLLFQSLIEAGAPLELVLESEPGPTGLQPTITYLCQTPDACWSPLVRSFRYLRLQPDQSTVLVTRQAGRRIRRRLHLAPAGNLDILRDDTGKLIPRLGAAVSPQSLYFLPIPRPIAPSAGLQRWTRTLALLQEQPGSVRLKATRARPAAREHRDVQLWLSLFTSTYAGRISDQQLTRGLRLYQSIAAGDSVCALEIEAWPDAVARAVVLDHDPDAFEIDESGEPGSLSSLPEQWRESLQRISSYWTMDEAVHLIAPPVTFAGSLGRIRHHLPSPFPSPGEMPGGADETELSLGTSVDGKAVALPLNDLASHLFVTGATGSGKSYTVRGLLAQLHRRGVPFLVIDPAKRDYSGWACSIGLGNAIVRFASDGQRFNPLLPPDGVTLYNHSAIFARVLSLMYPTTPAVFEILLAMTRAAYLHKLDRVWPNAKSQTVDFAETRLLMKLTGGDLVRDPCRIPSFAEFLSAGAKWLEEFGGAERSQWTRDVIDHFQRRWQLLRTSYLGWLFSPAQPNRRIDNFFCKSCVVELAEQTDPVESNVLMALILARLGAQRMNEPASPFLRHVTVIEEAHRIIPRHAQGWSDDTVGSPEQAVGELFARMLAEIRVSGEGIVVVEQSAGKILPDVLINCRTRIVHNVVYGPDQSLLATASGLGDEAARYLATLETGDAILTDQRHIHPVEVRVGRTPVDVMQRCDPE